MHAHVLALPETTLFAAAQRSQHVTCQHACNVAKLYLHVLIVFCMFVCVSVSDSRCKTHDQSTTSAAATLLGLCIWPNLSV